MRWLKRYLDRHGRERLYFRRPGFPSVALQGPIGSKAFFDDYAAALAKIPVEKAGNGSKTRKATEIHPRSFRRLVIDYYGSTDFLRTKASSQKVTRGILDKLCLEIGGCWVSQMTRHDVELLIAAKATTPGAANNRLKKLRALMGYAIGHGWRPDDPTAKIKRFREGEHHTWSEEQIAQFEAYWPLGTRQRLGFALALHTGQRRSDVAKMTWADVTARGSIRVAQQKGGGKLEIPLHRDLKTALEAAPRRHVVILATAHGSAPTDTSFGQFMAASFAAAGLPDECVLHGLRKAAARRLADAGSTVHQIMAITGHKSIEEVERYTRAASQYANAAAAIAKLEERK
jgi:integrase